MLEIINSQIKSRKTLVKSGFYQPFLSPDIQQITADLYPLCLNYFHELNPAFLFHLNRQETIQYSPMITVRDGSAGLASFILKNYAGLPKFKTHFSIHESLAPLIPPNSKDKFSCWKIIKKNQIKISQAKKVLVFGIISSQAFPDPKKTLEKLSILQAVSLECEIEIFLPIRKAPFGNTWKESSLAYEIISTIKDILPGRRLQFIFMKDILERQQWTETYLVDLMTEKLLLSDSFLNHFILQRGGSISGFESVSIPKSTYEMDLSLNHKIQYYPLPEVNSIFADMIFYKKKSSLKEYIADQTLHDLLREQNF